MKSVEIPVPDDNHQLTHNECRLWIGNIDQRINEFSMLKLVQKYGALEKFDFLYIKTGVDKGKPRGYCFVTYTNSQDALKAIKSLNGKLALGKTLHVKWAHEESESERDARSQVKKFLVEDNNPTDSSEMKIRAIEEKLKEMESTKKDFSVSVKPTLPPGSNKLSHIHRQTGTENTKQPYHKPRR